MVTTFKGLANKWVVLALLLASLGAVLAITLLPLGAQSGAIEFPENSEEAVADFTAVDPEGTSSATKWSIPDNTGEADPDGADLPLVAADNTDGHLFKIPNGVLEFRKAPNYEDTTRTGANAEERNTYAVVIAAQIGSKTSYEMVTVNVTNEDEDATTGIELSLIQPREGSPIRVLFADSVGNPFVGSVGLDLTAENPPTEADASGIVDPDGDKDLDASTNSGTTPSFEEISADNVAWQWYRGSNRTADTEAFEEIEDATSPIYAVQDDDNFHYLRVTATYEDGEGENKVLMATSLYTGLPLRTDTMPPVFSDTNPASEDPIDLAAAEIDDGSGEGTVVGTYAASREISKGERLTYSLIPATTDTGFNNTNFRAGDLDLFQINRETGQVTVAKGKTLNDSADVNAAIDEPSREQATGFVVRIRAVDGYQDITTNAVNMGTGDLTITVDGEDEAPVFTEAGGETSHELAENSAAATEIHTFAAYDPESETDNVTYAMSGPDEGDFTLTSAGELTINAIPDFEDPADANKDNTYEITVRASATSPQSGATAKSTSINVTVDVTNEDEPGTVALSARNPRIGVTITARLVSDQDGVVTDLVWQWERDGADNASTSCANAVDADDWTDAQGDGANTATYIPNSADNERCIRARASYTDPAGPGAETTQETDQLVVRARNLPPMFDEDMETRYVQENAATRDAVVANEDGMTGSTADPNADLVTADDSNDADQNDGPIDYNLSGADAMYFIIDSEGDDIDDTPVADDRAGQIRVSAAGAGNLDFETRRTYMVTVTAVDREGENSSIPVMINVTNEDEGPEIERGRLAVSGPPLVPFDSMGTGEVATYTAVGVDADGATWDLSGNDAGDFSIGETTGVLTFKTPPNTGSAMDANMDNVYEVTVEATASSGGMPATKMVFVTVGMATAPAARTDIGDYPNQERLDFNGDGTVSDSELQQAIIIWITDNPEN